MQITIQNAENILKKYLKNNENKYEHSLRVAKVCQKLANIWGASEEDAIIIGLIHDIGKSLNKKEMLNLCMQNKTIVYDFELWESAEALHGKISELLFKQEFERTEPERFDSIAHAISYHVAGGEDKMEILDKIIYIADYIEPKKNPQILKKIESGEIKDINECIKIIINSKKEKAKLKNMAYNPMIDITLKNIEEEEISK